MPKHFSQANILLLLIALIWGSTFIIVKQSLGILHPMQVIAYRFTLAFILVFLAKYRTVLRHWRTSLFPGIGIGLLLFLGFTTQTFGLKFTSPSTSALITGSNAVLVALFEALFKRKKLSRSSFFGVLTATAGLILITWSGASFTFGYGDLLTLACAIFFALHINATGQALTRSDPSTITVIQFAFVALAAWCSLIPVSGLKVNIPPTTWYALLYLGIMATGLAFLAQSYAQRDASPIHTAIMLATEPAFATVLSISLGFELMTMRLIIGGLLVITGIIFSSSGESFASSGEK
ncbi:MAG: DMT family transporter [Firmicutes bacterium]|nr:DMT family transporter [Bacillota bacterium]